MQGSIQSQVAVNTDNIAHLEREFDRFRERLHTMESTVHTIRVLTKAVDELQESMPTLARRAANEAVAADRRARHREWYTTARTYAALISAGAALGALIVALVLR